jgi:hypothetical protein
MSAYVAWHPTCRLLQPAEMLTVQSAHFAHHNAAAAAAAVAECLALEHCP